MKVKIYTDGSCKKYGEGGWAYIVLVNEKIYFKASGYESRTTNNRMEMTGIIKGIEKILSDPNLNNQKIDIYTDSAYIHNCCVQKWYTLWQKNGWINYSKQPVKNKDLWEKIIEYFECPSIFNFHKVKGHSGNTYNEMVDELAQSAALNKCGFYCEEEFK